MENYQRIANVVYDVCQFQIHNVFLLEKKRNMIMDGKFTKIIYSDNLFILYGIFLNVELIVDAITTNCESSNKHFYRFQTNHLFNEKTINEIIQIEHHILDFYRDTFKINKHFTTILRNQLYNGYIKTYSSSQTSSNTIIRRSDEFKQHNYSGFAKRPLVRDTFGVSNLTSHKGDPVGVSNRRDVEGCPENAATDEINGKKNIDKMIVNVYPKKEQFLLKISGIWEDSENIGLTYKFENIHSKIS